jgi:hypothetical protein
VLSSALIWTAVLSACYTVCWRETTPWPPLGFSASTPCSVRTTHTIPCPRWLSFDPLLALFLHTPSAGTKGLSCPLCRFFCKAIMYGTLCRQLLMLPGVLLGLELVLWPVVANRVSHTWSHLYDLCFKSPLSIAFRQLCALSALVGRHVSTRTSGDRQPGLMHLNSRQKRLESRFDAACNSGCLQCITCLHHSHICTCGFLEVCVSRRKELFFISYSSYLRDAPLETLPPPCRVSIWPGQSLAESCPIQAEGFHLDLGGICCSEQACSATVSCRTAGSAPSQLLTFRFVRPLVSCGTSVAI